MHLQKRNVNEVAFICMVLFFCFCLIVYLCISLMSCTNANDNDNANSKLSSVLLFSIQPNTAVNTKKFSWSPECNSISMQNNLYCEDILAKRETNKLLKELLSYWEKDYNKR